MEKRNTLLLTVIAIATLLVAIVGAAFAYVASDLNVDKEVSEKITERGTSKFSATGSSISVFISSQQMDATDPSQNYNTQLGTLSVSYNSARSRETSCKYDINYRWTSSDKYLDHSRYMENNVYTENVGKEFTVTVSSVINNYTGNNITATQLDSKFLDSQNHEVDFSELDGCDTQNGCKIGSGILYSNTNELDKATTVTWSFKTTVYNLPHSQADSIYGIADKNYTGEFFVSNIEC